MNSDDRNLIHRAVKLLRGSRSILVITGAGLSADSGLPTYRGVNGLYENIDDIAPIEQILSPEMLSVRPELTWKYLLQIEEATRGARPNRGHQVIAEMQGRFDRVCVLTQNVDGLHQRAGSRNVIDIHGTFNSLRCMRCSYRQETGDFVGLSIPPRCPTCEGVLRPNVVLFGEYLPERQVSQLEAEEALGFDLVMSIGTTSQFPYIAGPVLDAHRRGRPSIEINPGTTDVSRFATIKLAMGAAAALDAIWLKLNGS